MVVRIAVVAGLLVLMGGCCACPPKEKPVTLPPAMTVQEQVSALNGRARAIAFLSAKGSVKMTWAEKERVRTETADAVVRLRQRYGAEAVAKHGGDAMLIGRFAGQEVFQVGKNPEMFWFLVRLDTKTAWVGNPAEAVTMAGGPALRADALMDLMGIGELPEGVVQRQTENARYVELLVLNDVLEQVITVDRFTGLPVSVVFYDGNGVPAITAKLSDYRDAPYRDGEKFRADVMPQKVPYRVEVEYPLQKARVELKLEEASIPSGMKDIVFRSPNFEVEGLRVEVIR